MKALQVGIIGLGVGEQHLQGYAQHPSCLVRTVCDFNAEKVAAVLARFPGIRGSTSAQDVLDDPEVDLVSIASYDNYHCEQVVRALENGKHVLVEKPLCLFPHEAAAIYARLVEDTACQLSCNLPLRTCPRFVRARNLVRGGDLGTVFYLEGDYLWGRTEKITEGWRKDMEFYSIVHGAAVHMIDLIMWVMDARPVEVVAYGNKLATAGSSLRFNDFAAMLLRFDNGVLAKVSAAGGCAHPHFHRLAVFGDKKTFLHELNGACLVELAPDGERRTEVTEEYPAKEERVKLLTSFVEYLLDPASKPLVSAQEALDVMAVCFAAEASVKQGKPQKVQYLSKA